ncbi:hypothetical protein MMC27_004814 [Xylographa pallens]|nr:hypothetical protein [Xylographa pallens]
MASIEKTVTLISGGNTGIGLAVATQLAKAHGHHVIIGSRNAAAGEEAAAMLMVEGSSASSVQLDLTDEESIQAAVGLIEREFGVLDVLINNAGVLLDRGPRPLDVWKAVTTRELFTRTFAVNVIGTTCLTEACLPLLLKSELPRIVFVSTRMGSLAVAQDKSMPFYKLDYKAYDSSKAAVNMLALNYDRILADKGGLVNIACPGLVKTNLTNNHPMGTSTEVGAQRIVELATAPEGSATATFSDRFGEVPF